MVVSRIAETVGMGIRNSGPTRVSNSAVKSEVTPSARRTVARAVM